MFGSIPNERIHAHDWRGGVVKIGELSAEYVREVSGCVADWPMPIWLNRMLIEEPWDLIINIGHVVPHEVLGFANHNKNYFIGLGGKDLICAAHMMAACCGIENNLGCLVTPVRQCFNKAEDELLGLFPNLAERAASAGTHLSGGEQQMLAIARILRTGARVLTPRALAAPVKEQKKPAEQADQVAGTLTALDAAKNTRA